MKTAIIFNLMLLPLIVLPGAFAFAYFVALFIFTSRTRVGARLCARYYKVMLKLERMLL